MESEAWKTHYCTVGGHCITTLGAQDHDDDYHWNWCGEGCTAKVNVEPHVFGSAVITKQPTTTEEGILTYYCDCGYSKTEPIPVVTEEGHTHTCVPTVIPATCTSGGYTTYTCECGYSYRANETDPLDHAYGYQKDASGHWLKCEHCSDAKPVEPHKYGAWTVTKEASYTETGTKQRSCLICGYVDEAEIPVIAHSGQYVITFEGTDIPEMLTVGASHKVPELPVLSPKEEGNFFNGWIDKATGAPVKEGDILTGDVVLIPIWKECGDGNHTDSNNDLVCDDCGEKLSPPVSYVIIEGAYSTWKKGETTSLSFKSSADFTKFVCVKVDGTVIDAEYYITEPGSTKVTLKAEYLNTLSVGEHELIIVSSDGAAGTWFTVLAADEPGHTHNLTKVESKPASCTEDGNKAYYRCSGCGRWFEDESGNTEITDHSSVVIAATGHEYAWIIDKAATATELGSKHEECKVCGDKKASVEIPATGTPGDPTKPTDPTEPSNPAKPSDPTNPTDPAKPVDPTKPDESKLNTGTTDSPKTGDNSMMPLWITLLFVSGVGVFGICIFSRRKKKCAE